MRKSIALLITMFFLLSIIFILNVILNKYEIYTNKNHTTYIAQNSIIIRNTLKTLSKISDQVKTSEDLKKLFTTIPLSSNKGDFRIIYTIQPLFNKIDINALLNQNKINTFIENYIDNILNYYQVKDPVLFKDLLLDTIDSDDKEREAYSEIIIQNPFFQNGKIYNITHLEQIEHYYYKKTNDKNIFNIPWNELIFFGNGKKHIIECNLINKNVAQFLGLTRNNADTCKSLQTEENNETIKNLNIIAYDGNQSFWIKTNITYFINQQKQNIKITYDLHNKKVISIESNPIY
ncbi:hypothetical protein [Nautilia lithotrophica]